MGLQQHFCDPGGAAEIPVDLERGMSVEEIGESITRQRLGQHFVRVIAIEKAGPKLIFQALLQPVPPSPRKSKDWRAAAANSGVPRRVISFPG